MSQHESKTVYEVVGGDAPFKQLVDRFYALVEADEYLRPMFPEDLEPGKKWQFLFLVQYFGGPTRYIEERGHPRLRMRHAPFPIDKKARDHWLQHMLTALDELDIAPEADRIMREYFERASTFMINDLPPLHPDREDIR
jgi:hemoglobin